MELQLVKEEDVLPIEDADECPEINVGKSEDVINMQDVLMHAYELATCVLEVDEFSVVMARNPKYGCQMQHFVKGNVVIVANYRGAKVPIMEVLSKSDAEIVIQDLIRIRERMSY